MPSTHFLLGQQIRGHQEGKRGLTLLEHGLHARRQAYRDTSTHALLTHHLIEYRDPWLRSRETESQRDHKDHQVAMAAPGSTPQPMLLCSLLSSRKGKELRTPSICNDWFPHFSEQAPKTDPPPQSPQDAYFNNPFLYSVFSLHCGSCSQNVRINQPRNSSAVLEHPETLRHLALTGSFCFNAAGPLLPMPCLLP